LDDALEEGLPSEAGAQMPTKALIIGGGVAGLTAAIGLRRAGIEPIVFERADELRKVSVGGGLHIWPNAIKALRQIDLGDRVEAIGAAVEHSHFRTWRGELIADLPVGASSRKVGAVTVGVSRGDLHALLAEVLGSDAIRLGAECVGFTQDATGVVARFRDGREERGDLLVGADGLRSTVRSQLLGLEEPRYSGYTSWLALVDLPAGEAPADVLTVMFGRGSRFIYYHVGGGRFGWIANKNTPAGGSDSAGAKAAVLETYDGWAEPVATLVAHTDEPRIVRMDLSDRPPAKRWGEGRVTLLGDAAHPMTPNIAQGACQGIEDAVVLPKSLTSEPDIATALRAYEERRKKRTATLTKRSRMVGAIGQWESPLLCAFRDRVLLKGFQKAAVKNDEKLFAFEV
jgi:2-polyprenyl-6-methoxyphenol hydroxylase-like FAD-dependent oxidoreductase